LLASILKNKHIFPMPPALPTRPPQPPTQPTRKPGKASGRGVKRTATSPIVIDPPVTMVMKEPNEKPLVKRWKRLLLDDHILFQNPDIKTPFKSRNDAMRRLLCYHVCQDTENPTMENKQFDENFDVFANNFRERTSILIERMNQMMFKQVQDTSFGPDEVMVGRLYMAEEQERFLHQRKAVLEGRAFIVRNEDNDELNVWKSLFGRIPTLPGIPSL